jgi:hypothetical protein
MSVVKKKLLDEIRGYRREWGALIGKVEEMGLIEAPLTTNRSTKDLIAHITWYERQTVEIMKNKTLIGSEWSTLTQDKRNDRIYHQNKARSYSSVRQESETVFQELVRQINILENEDLLNPAKYKDMPEDWSPVELLAEKTYRHYKQHIPAVLELLRNQKRPEK